MKFYCFVAVVASLALTTSALNCWICENAKTNQECMDRGRLKQCQPNQQACQNEVRTDNQGLRITKRCKQAHACDNNFIQNPRPAWFPTQCNLDIPHSVCRCCCNTDECNKPLLGCLGARCTPAHTNPANGRVECSDSNNDGSVCTFTCNPGYELVGGPASTCTVVDDVGAWSSPAPTCRPTRCIPPQTAPFNGGVSCTNGNTVGSVCSFTCDAGYFLQGSTSTTCGEDNRWTNRPPICPAIVCPPPQSAPVNGGVSCSNGNRLGSDCAFTCDAGYTLIGDTNRVCVDDNDNDAQGIWTNSVPTCRRNVCDPPHVDPTNGLVDCSDSNNEGSVCEFVCNAGYSLVGDQTSQCLNIDGVGVWSTQAPVCQRITCEPPHSAPANGAVTCTDSNNESSDCTFRCDANFALVGAPVSTCRDDGNGDVFGLWSTPAPTCEPIVCEPPQDSPSNGQISCSLENFATSICTFTCDPTYALVGNSEVTCLDDGDGDTAGVWSSPPPTCQPIVCLPPHVDPQNGGVSCSLDNRETSVCDFTCNEGYALVGEPSSTCLDDGNGDALGVWSFPAPVCERKTCGVPPAAPENGFRVCTDGNFLGSQCEFGCDPFHTRVGPLYTNCIEPNEGNLIWDNPAPICQPNECPDQGVLLHGNYSCSNDNFATSTCTFECTGEGYEIYPPGRDQNTCLNDTAWTLPKPCCARDCPPYAVMDAVFILDSSSSIGDENWPIMQDFVRTVLSSYILAPDSARLAVFRYNRAVDTNSEILLGDFDNIDDFIAKFNEIPYDGSGTRTGNALNHTRNVVFQEANGDRPNVKNVALVITDGRSQDDVGAISEQLRADGVLTYALGIQPPSGSLDEGQLNQIAGDPGRLLIAEGSFADLGESLSNQLAEQICGDPCFDAHRHDELTTVAP